jgi:tetratricopeptide (TPR) repeat protein
MRKNGCLPGRSSFVSFALLASAFLFGSAPLFGQGSPYPSESPMIQGEVQLPNGNPAPFVLLVLEPENGGGFLGSATTDSAGFYTFSKIIVGANYTIVVNVEGFRPVHRLVMVTGYSTTENFTLEPVPGNGEPDEGSVVPLKELKVPPQALAEYRKGVAEMNAGQNAEAVFRFREAIRIYPQYAAGYRRLGAAYANLGRFSDADRAIQHALRLDRKSSESYAYLGYVYEKEKRTAEAEAAFLKSIGIAENDWFAQLELGRLLYNRKDYQSAYPHLELARKLRPQAASTHLLLYNDLIRLNKSKEALAELDDFVARFPKSKEAAEMRKVRPALAAAAAKKD